MSKAKNQETTVETKNTEVKANLNGQEVILIIPVAKSGYQGLQSTKSKNKDKITLHFERNEVEKGEEEIKKISQKYLELVKPFLTNLFKGFEGSISFTEAKYPHGLRLRFSWRKEGYFQPDRRRLKGRNVLEYCQIMN